MPVAYLKTWLKRAGTPSPATKASRPTKSQLKLEILEDRTTPAVGSLDLGAANDYNVFVTGNFNAQYSDVEGRLAVGGNATITGYSVGDKLNTDGGNSLVVGGNLDLSNGQVNHGNIAVGGTANVAQNVGIPQGSVTHDTPVDFNAAAADLKQKSQDWASEKANGNVVNNWGTLTLTGTDSGLNVFSLSADQLAKANGISINAPAGSTVLINVTGSDVSMGNFAIWLNGVDKSNVLFNFSEAKTLTLNAIGVPGTILAPNAHVFFNNGQVNGSIIAESFCGNGQVNFTPPPTPICGCPVGRLSGKVVIHNPCGCTDPVSGVDVTITGVGPHGSVHQTVQTNVNGEFAFNSLHVSKIYSLSISLPGGDTIEKISIGTGGGTADGDTVTGIHVTANETASGYVFTLSPPPSHTAAVSPAATTTQAAATVQPAAMVSNPTPVNNVPTFPQELWTAWLNYINQLSLRSHHRIHHHG